MLRIKQLRTEHGLRQIDFAKEMGILQSTLSSWENERYEPDIAMLMKMANYFGVTVDYLTGKSESNMTPSPSSPNGTMVPVLGDVAGGVPLLAVENILDYEEISKELAKTGEIIGLRVKGHSMEPRICDGDVVIVRRQEDADTGDVAVILVNGDSATVKRIKRDADGSLWLIPNNPAYEAKHYSPQEQENLQVRIFGKVVELRGKF